VLESGIGTGMGPNASVKNLAKVGSKENQGVEAMRALRKANVNHLERNRVKLTLGDAKHDNNVEDDDNSNIDSENEDVHHGGIGSDDDDEYLYPNDDYSDVDDQEDVQEEDRPIFTSSDAEGSRVTSKKSNKRPRSHEVEVDGDDNMSMTSAAPAQLSIGTEKPRLSIAERKRLKKQGLSHDEISRVAHQKAQSEGEYHTLDDQQQQQGKKVSGANGTFKDMKFYMTYGTEDERATFAEETLQPKSGLKGVEALGAVQLEGALLDMSTSTEALDANKKKKITRWDEKKKKFVKVDNLNF
jgi:hypothetical protein